MPNNEQQTLFDKIKDSALEGLKPRVQDPFVSVYSVSFLIWNYQIFIFAFSSMDATAKYTSIRSSLDLNAFIVPIAPVIFLNFLFPWAFLGLYKLSESLKIDLSNALNTVRAKHFTSATIISRLEEEVELFRKRVSEKDLRISELEYKSSKSIDELKSTHQIEVTEIYKKHAETLKILQDKDISSDRELRQAKELIKKLEKEAASTQTNEPLKIFTKSQAENVYNFLIKNGLRADFQNLYEQVSTTHTFYKRDVETSNLAKYLLKELFTLEEVDEGFGRVDIIHATDLGKLVYAESLEDPIPF